MTGDGAEAEPSGPRVRFTAVPMWLPIVAVIAIGLVLRLWGVRHGLPYAYSVDERANFVPRAVGFLEGDLNPGYFVNPPGFSYLLAGVMALWFGGSDGVTHAAAATPGDLFAAGRITAAALGAAAVGLLYWAGTEAFGRWVGILAAATMATAFLPVHYAHLAVNDAPALLPSTLAVLGALLVLRRGRRRDYALAGLGVGLAAATKYTSGVGTLAVVAAALPALGDPSVRRRAMQGLLLASAVAAAAFLVANPYSVLDAGAFVGDIGHQFAAAEHDKLGLRHRDSVGLYLESLTWGLGWVPLVAAVAGAALLLRDDRVLAPVLLGPPLVLLLFLGYHERAFARWLLPAYPFLCLMAGYGAVRLASAVTRARPRLRPFVLGAAGAVLIGQGLVHSIHGDLVLARGDTRAATRAWLAGHVPAGESIVVEPFAPRDWVLPRPQLPDRPEPRPRWSVISLHRVSEHREAAPEREDYLRLLYPSLLDDYRRRGACWVVSASIVSGRASGGTQAARDALAYYRALADQADVAYRASPYGRGEGPVEFDFDLSYNYYPLDYTRPGPEMTVYRLRGGRCDRA